MIEQWVLQRRLFGRIRKIVAIVACGTKRTNRQWRRSFADRRSQTGAWNSEGRWVTGTKICNTTYNTQRLRNGAVEVV